MRADDALLVPGMAGPRQWRGTGFPRDGRAVYTAPPGPGLGQPPATGQAWAAHATCRPSHQYRAPSVASAAAHNAPNTKGAHGLPCTSTIAGARTKNPRPRT